MKLSSFAMAVASVLIVQTPRGKAELVLRGARVSIDYGRPRLDGRDMRSLLPVGHAWRLGADEATELITSHDLTIGDVEIPAGAYSLFLERTGDAAWELVLNTETGQWGTQHDVTLDIANVPLETSESELEAEQLTIELSENQLTIQWGHDVLRAKVLRD